MPIIYSIYPHASGEKYVFRSKDEAAAAARKLIADDADINEVDVIKHETPPLTVTTLIDVINAQGGAYSVGENVVHTIRRRGKPKPAKAPPEPVPDNWVGRAYAGVVDTVNGQRIHHYPGSNRGKPIYAVGGVGFRSLAEARQYAATLSEPTR